MITSINGIDIIYEDNHLLVVRKPIGLKSQADNDENDDLLNELKKYIKEKYNKPGNVYLGLVHRLDRNVGGVMVFGKTSKSSSRLSKVIRENEFHKKYLAIVSGSIKNDGSLVDFVSKKDLMCVAGDKVAKLDYKVINNTIIGSEVVTLVDIKLLTGRFHQIRYQFAVMKHPIVGDYKYGYKGSINTPIALVCNFISFPHPITGEILSFSCNIENEIFKKIKKSY